MGRGCGGQAQWVQQDLRRGKWGTRKGKSQRLRERVAQVAWGGAWWTRAREGGAWPLSLSPWGVWGSVLWGSLWVLSPGWGVARVTGRAQSGPYSVLASALGPDLLPRVPRARERAQWLPRGAVLLRADGDSRAAGLARWGAAEGQLRGSWGAAEGQLGGS